MYRQVGAELQLPPLLLLLLPAKLPGHLREIHGVILHLRCLLLELLEFLASLGKLVPIVGHSLLHRGWRGSTVRRPDLFHASTPGLLPPSLLLAEERRTVVRCLPFFLR